MVSVRSCVTGEHLRYVTQREARALCGEDFAGNALDAVEPKAVRITRKKETLKDIRLLHPEGTGANSRASISARESETNALVEIGLAIDGATRISRMEAISDKIANWSRASEDNRSVTITPAGIIGLTEVCV